MKTKKANFRMAVYYPAPLLKRAVFKKSFRSFWEEAEFLL